MSTHKPFPEPLSEPVSYTEQVYQEEHRHKLFDVTQVVGSVYSGGTSDPLVAAMIVIGEALSDLGVAPKGTFSFPTEDGLSVTVTIDTRNPD